MKRRLLAALILGLCAGAPATGAPNLAATVCAGCVRANMERLAGDALHGRRCGSEDEHAAANLIAVQLRRYGVEGAFGRGAYLQPAQLLTPTFAQPPVLEIVSAGATRRLAVGVDMVPIGLPASLDAPLARLAPGVAAGPELQGKVVIDDPRAGGPPAAEVLKAGAAAVIVPAVGLGDRRWDALVQRAAGPTQVVGGFPHEAPTGGAVILVKPEVFASLADVTEGRFRLAAARGAPRARTTYNVVGVIHGHAHDADQHAILLSAHYDHLGVRDGLVFHGANDDASGTAAVLEFARIFGAGARPRRTIYFALFGCEEEGELGSEFFDRHPPTPLPRLSANLEFEMIGVDDPNKPGSLMLTGWERTNLGPTLQAHGALVEPDVHPEQHFFQRSDNYQLALSGVVAQTVTAWPLPPTYHMPSDDLAHVDLAFMDRVIGSLVEPIRWLADSDFQPAWNPGGQP